ncbi:hypothetical protein N798_08900 [Knoellia flava TL1]|uniref:Uncharacterized protein n=1 Tax=Knoellia flava TL1 TaxID=1385518 RepID=A0ABR4XE35_9MICO|nr:hypothetical protein N798_08900 [Knoellia flava TL1]
MATPFSRPSETVRAVVALRCPTTTNRRAHRE